jgi:hypothetical protein
MPPPPPEIITKAQIEASFPGVADAEGWVLAVEAAHADAESAFREKAADGGWSSWSAQPTDINAASPSWEAAAEYVWTLVQAHNVASNERAQSPARLEAFLDGEILVLCDMVFREKLLPTSSDRPMQDSPDGPAFLFYARSHVGARLQKLLLDAWKEHAVRLKAGPASGRKPERKTAGPRGPKADVENAGKVLGIVKLVCGDGWQGAWKKNLVAITTALDEAAIPMPKTWKARKPAPIDWPDALEQDEKILTQAIDYRINQASHL